MAKRLSGGDLARRAVAQASRFGVEILTPQEVTGLRIEGPYKHLTLSDGSEVSCHVLMLAMGVFWKMLEVEGADRFVGSGVYYGAAVTEAMHAKGKTVFMVGAGNSSGQAAMHFKDHASEVVILVRGDSLAAKMAAPHTAWLDGVLYASHLGRKMNSGPSLDVRRRA